MYERFSQLHFSNETALPPDALLRALAESCNDQRRFHLGFMDDATEGFENMLLRIHAYSAHGETEDMSNVKHSIHQNSAMTLVELSVCSTCGSTSESLPFTQMVHYVLASELTAQARQISPSVDLFGQLLIRASRMGDICDCPSTCGGKIQIHQTLTNRLEIVSVGINWDLERLTLKHIMDVFGAIGTTLRLAYVFNSVVGSRWADTALHNLVGVVTYYGKNATILSFFTQYYECGYILMMQLFVKLDQDGIKLLLLSIDNAPEQINTDEAYDYILYDKPPKRESKSLFSRIKETFHYLQVIYSLILITIKTLRKEKIKKITKKRNTKKGNKKQHKIRRELFVCGLACHKNRSMPDLAEGIDDYKMIKKPVASSVDDSNVGIKEIDNNLSSMSGYHLQFSAITNSPKLERSLLMRKIFRGCVGKVSPSLPIRTISKLTNNKQHNVRSSLSYPLHLPPCHSPSRSVVHPRQGSAEFPLPPSPLDLSAREEHLPVTGNAAPSGYFLSQLQSKILHQVTIQNCHKQNYESRSFADSWLKEVQAKQETLRVVKRGMRQYKMIVIHQKQCTVKI
ncbi:hypothetical protein FQA39_LY08322 [Lamprigera yunnana]|nr:hypothetical protein FQA39_LY08322 [Lamprigera yunnana]